MILLGNGFFPSHAFFFPIVEPMFGPITLDLLVELWVGWQIDLQRDGNITHTRSTDRSQGEATLWGIGFSWCECRRVEGKTPWAFSTWSGYLCQCLCEFANRICRRRWLWRNLLLMCVRSEGFLIPLVRVIERCHIAMSPECNTILPLKVALSLRSLLLLKHKKF